MSLRFERPVARLLLSSLLMAGATAGLLASSPAAAGSGLDIIAIGTAATDAEDANGQPEDGCQLHFEVGNRGAVALSTLMIRFSVVKASTGEALQAHFPIALSKLGAGDTQRTPPDLIHGVTCPDLKVRIKGQTCIAERIIDCPPLALAARGLAAIERSKPQ